jgi:hypothetical protein
MIRQIINDAPSAIQLLRQHHTYHRMRQRKPGQCPAFIGLLEAFRRQPFRPTDQQREVIATGEPGLQFGGKGFGVQLLSASVERDNTRARGNGGKLAMSFLFDQTPEIGALGAPASGNLMQHQAAFARQAFGVLLKTRFDPIRHAVTDGNDVNLHIVS